MPHKLRGFSNLLGKYRGFAAKRAPTEKRGGGRRCRLDDLARGNEDATNGKEEGRKSPKREERRIRRAVGKKKSGRPGGGAPLRNQVKDKGGGGAGSHT